MGSDSIDPKLFRLSITASGLRLNPPVQLFLYTLFKPVISQHPCLVGFLPDLGEKEYGVRVKEYGVRVKTPGYRKALQESGIKGVRAL
jgi:hypothetical protein